MTVPKPCEFNRYCNSSSLTKGVVNGDQTFGCVWYLPHENRWRDLNILAYRDTGKLTVAENSIEFHGSKETVVITKIKRVTFGKQGRDFVNNWVIVEYGDGTPPSVAFFADGSLLGWGGIFGGTKRILGAMQEHTAGLLQPNG